MPYITSIERMGMEKGRQQGVQEGEVIMLKRLLTRRFGALPAWAVQRLEQAGLVIRRPNPRDRRVNVLVVTARGATVRKQLIARLLDPPAAFSRMPVGEQARFREVMRETLSGRGSKAARREGRGRRT